MERLEPTLRRKSEIAKQYRESLAGKFEFQAEQPCTTHSHWMVCLLVDDAEQRDPVREHLGSAGIETRPVFYPIHSMPMYARSYRRMPVADDVSSRGINLPSHPELTEQEIDYVCETLSDASTRLEQ